MPVWGRAVRLFHWALVLALALCTAGLWWLNGAHQPAGYAALALVLFRLLWGALAPPSQAGGRYARWGQFVRGPGRTLKYGAQWLRGQEPRYIGHNPLGGWMVVALLACVLGLALTGWLYTTDAFFGDETVESLHRALAWLLLGLFALHLVGVGLASRRHRENLVRAMVSGRKRAPRGSDVA